MTCMCLTGLALPKSSPCPGCDKDEAHIYVLLRTNEIHEQILSVLPNMDRPGTTVISVYSTQRACTVAWYVVKDKSTHSGHPLVFHTV